MDISTAVRTVIGLLDPATAWSHLFRLQSVAFTSQSQFELHLRNAITFDEYLAELARLDSEDQQKLILKAQRDAKVKLIAGSWRQRSLQANADFAQVKALVETLKLLPDATSTYDDLWLALQDELKGAVDEGQLGSATQSRRGTIDSLPNSLIASPIPIKHTSRSQDSKSVDRPRDTPETVRDQQSVPSSKVTPAETPGLARSKRAAKRRADAAARSAHPLHADAPPTPAISTATGSPIPRETVPDVKSNVSSRSKHDLDHLSGASPLAPAMSQTQPSPKGMAEVTAVAPRELDAAQSSAIARKARRNARRRSQMVQEIEPTERDSTPITTRPRREEPKSSTIVPATSTSNAENAKQDSIEPATSTTNAGNPKSEQRELDIVTAKTDVSKTTGATSTNRAVKRARQRKAAEAGLAQTEASESKAAKSRTMSNEDGPGPTTSFHDKDVQVSSPAPAGTNEQHSRKRKRTQQSDMTDTPAPKNKLARTVSPIPSQLDGTTEQKSQIVVPSTMEPTTDVDISMIEASQEQEASHAFAETSLPEREVIQPAPVVQVATNSRKDAVANSFLDGKSTSPSSDVDESSVISSDSDDDNDVPLPDSVVSLTQRSAETTADTVKKAPSPQSSITVVQSQTPLPPTNGQTSPKHTQVVPKTVPVQPNRTSVNNNTSNTVPRAQGPQATMDALRRLEKFAKYGDENYATSEEEDSESSSSDESSEDVGPVSLFTSAPHLSVPHSDHSKGPHDLSDEYGAPSPPPQDSGTRDVVDVAPVVSPAMDSVKDQSLNTELREIEVENRFADTAYSSESASDFVPDPASDSAFEPDAQAPANDRKETKSDPEGESNSRLLADFSAPDKDAAMAVSPTEVGSSSQKRKRRTFEKVSKFFDGSPDKPLDKKKRVPAGTSAVPFPSTDASRFGLMQEKFADNPYRLLLATAVCNKTAGRFAIPTLYNLLETYPEPRDLANADAGYVGTIIQHLGFQNQRARTLIRIAQGWIEAPPEKSKRYRTLHYPRQGDGAEIRPSDVMLDDAHDCAGALEIGHLYGCGVYAYDSWRIFCRDTLRGVNVADNEPEWKRVVPTDKELRAYLRWMWLREGYVWDPLTGDKFLATADQLADAKLGVLEQQAARQVASEDQPAIVIASPPLETAKQDEKVQETTSHPPPSSTRESISTTRESTPQRTTRAENTRQRSVRRKDSTSANPPSPAIAELHDLIDTESPLSDKQNVSSVGHAPSGAEITDLPRAPDIDEETNESALDDVIMQGRSTTLEDVQACYSSSVVEQATADMLTGISSSSSPLDDQHSVPGLKRRQSQFDGVHEVADSDSEGDETQPNRPAADDHDDVAPSIERQDTIRGAREGVATFLQRSNDEIESGSGSEYLTSNEDGYSTSDHGGDAPRQASEELI